MLYSMGMDGTKWNIFNVAIDLFAKNGYSNVSIRDIAETAKIKSSSIYYHFDSKVQILEQIYAYYEYYYHYFLPSLDEVLEHVEEEQPKEVLFRTMFQYDSSIAPLMDKIFSIITIEALSGDKQAEKIIHKTTVEMPRLYITTILQRMAQIGKIEPVDVDAFLLAYSSLVHSSNLRMSTSYPVDRETWMKSVDMIFSLVS